MNPIHFIRLLFFYLLFSISNITTGQEKPLNVSGVYPAFAAFNANPNRSVPQKECGIGQLVPWAGKLWYTTYSAHALYESSDKLHTVDLNYRHEIRPESVGGTHACRMIHKESNQLIIGCYFIDEEGNVRVVSRSKMPGRLTAVARHLTDPENKVLFFSQEGAIFEVNVHTLEPELIEEKPVAGWHGKGAYTSQGVFVISNNGEQPAPAPYWGDIDYSATFNEEKRISKYYKTLVSYAPENMGSLSEWDGEQWKTILRKQYCEVTGPGGLTGATNNNEQIWATGWDKRSGIISVRNNDNWAHYRFLKPSYTIEGFNGSFTEWPRIREIETGHYLSFFNGALFDFPANFKPSNIGGFKPVSSMLRIVTDFCSWDNQLVLASQQTAGPILDPGQPNSNLLFTSYKNLSKNGPAIGWGGVWRNDYIKADSYSDPLLISGYDYKTIHFYQTGAPNAHLDIEIDVTGNGSWSLLETIPLNAGEYKFKILPENLKAEALRFKSDKDIKAICYVHAFSNRESLSGEKEIFQGIQNISEFDLSTTEIINCGYPSRNLNFLTIDKDGNSLLYEVDETLKFHLKDDEKTIEQLSKSHEIKLDVFVDDASVVVKRFDSKIFRIPMGVEGYTGMEKIRGVRGVVEDRYLGNLAGTFFEIPRYGSGRPNPRDLPDFERMKPVSTHGLGVHDFTVWRGLFVMAGLKPNTSPSEHIFMTNDQSKGLWFGEIDELWRLGKPVGIGGPWMNSHILANIPSDPYLMTGYDKKTLELSHNAASEVKFIIEIDFLADGNFHFYKTIKVPAGENIIYQFPDGFSAHWIRLLSDKDCTATAQLIYR